MEKALFTEYEGARYGFDTRDDGGARIYNSININKVDGMRYEKTKTVHGTPLLIKG